LIQDEREMTGPLSKTRMRAAIAVAAAADAAQLVFFPAFGAGALSPLDDVLDVAVGGTMVLLLGWHWAFLPAFAAELIPGVDLAPTWTAAALWVIRARRLAEASLPPAPER
jgi:hypothetical protein